MDKLSKLSALKGVGPKFAEQLQRLNIHNLTDLCFHLPFRYEDRSRIVPIAGLQSMRPAVLQGEIRGSTVLFGKRRSLLVKVQDATGTVSLRFYHFNAAQKAQLHTGQLIRCYGEPRRGASGLEIYHPEYQCISSFDEQPDEPRLTPVYSATEGISQQRLRLLHEQVNDLLEHNRIDLPDLFPEEWSAQWRLPGLREALLFLHNPSTDTNLKTIEMGQHPAQKRLILEELLAHQLSLFKLRAQVKADASPAFVLPKYPLLESLLTQLPFTPTNAQQRVHQEILTDLQQPHPMLRLVQGDVGSGKTLVAAMAACAALQCGYQVALMAPTEILAEQHLSTMRAWFEPLGINVGWLAGKLKGKAREAAMQDIIAGDAQFIVGTHALFQEEVAFAKLGLIIIDEQHRFGVHQRLSLKEKGRDGLVPHQLIMTATPIPRTLAMSAYADLDTSVIDELPPGRSPISTVAISDQRRPEIIQRVQEACSDGAQAYWVCTLIEESEALQCQAAENTAEDLRLALSNLRVGLVHGRMKAAEKAAVMDDFKQHRLDLLVATTVIEVGVDVPNASLMIIENPERLGLAQLHQLRGRVGRGSAKSHCVLLYKSPLSLTSKQRIQVLRDSQDGFYIAEQDLQIRGPGELLGTRQTGLQMLRIADLQRDADLLPQVQTMANQLWHNYPQTIAPLIERWLGESERFANV
ncbi:MAG: ATP-dependent DNA helicase RecG [Oleibacter sp.]|nr:ATP-dependent DNA helicase RecG [Thalassolituus sp.]